VLEVNRWATEGLLPDLTIYLAIDPAKAAARAGEADRFEDEGAGLQERVRAAYERLAEAEPRRWVRVEADRAAEQVHADVLAAVEAARAGAPAG
jgi:dTMP kinase